MPALVWLQDSRERVFGSGFWNNFRALAEIAWNQDFAYMQALELMLAFGVSAPGLWPSSTPKDERSEDLICKARDE